MESRSIGTPFPSLMANECNMIIGSETMNEHDTESINEIDNLSVSALTKSTCKN